MLNAVHAMLSVQGTSSALRKLSSRVVSGRADSTRCVVSFVRMILRAAQARTSSSESSAEQLLHGRTMLHMLQHGSCSNMLYCVATRLPVGRRPHKARGAQVRALIDVPRTADAFCESHERRWSGLGHSRVAGSVCRTGGRGR